VKAVRLESIENLFVREVAKPAPGPGDLLVRVEACGICGSDRHFLHGEFPTSPPVTLGHEFSGIVETVGAEVTGFRPGMRVTVDPNISCGRCPACQDGLVNHCRNWKALGLALDGGFAEYTVVPEGQAVELPLSLHPEHGAFCEPLACCLHAVDLAGIKAGDSVVVLGGGVIGLLTLQLARLAGATRVILSTRQAVRRELAMELGATDTVDPSAADPVQVIAGPDGLVPGGVDVVMECAGVPDTVRQSLKLAKRRGTVMIVGVMPQGQTIEIEPCDIMMRELRIQGSFINPFVHRRAAALITSGAIEVGRLVSQRIGLDQVPEVIGRDPLPGEVKVMVIP